MELLVGRSLETAFEEGRLEAREAIGIVQQAAKGLADAEGVTHRDLKPGNVFLTQSEEGEPLVKVLDFGIARLSRRLEPASSAARRASEPTKLTLHGMVLGTADYMSPSALFTGLAIGGVAVLGAGVVLVLASPRQVVALAFNGRDVSATWAF